MKKKGGIWSVVAAAVAIGLASGCNEVFGVRVLDSGDASIGMTTDRNLLDGQDGSADTGFDATVAESGPDVSVADATEEGGCSGGQVACGGGCVDGQSDPNNCGGCGNVCTSPVNGSGACNGGSCGITCNTGYVACAGVCVNGQSDPSNCGGCGVGCNPPVANGTASCAAGACAIACNAGYVACNGTCVNAQTDPGNCGACGDVCQPGATGGASCISGVCSQWDPLESTCRHASLSIL